MNTFFGAALCTLAAVATAATASASTCTRTVPVNQYFNNPDNIGYEVVRMGDVMRQAGLYQPGARLIAMSLQVQANTQLVMAWKNLAGNESGPAILVQPSYGGYGTNVRIDDSNWAYANIAVPQYGGYPQPGTFNPDYFVVNATRNGNVINATITVDTPGYGSCGGGWGGEPQPPTYGQCTATSRGRTYSGRDLNDAVNSCRAAYGSDYWECSETARCDNGGGYPPGGGYPGEGRPMQCHTQSNGQAYTGRSQREAEQACRNGYRTNPRECRDNMVCRQ